MAARLLFLGLRTVNSSCGKRMIPLGACGAHSSSSSPIGNREIVGFGFNGIPNYADRPDFPMPAVRYRETTPDIQALREKEKGDWKKLSKEEKKALYRASFCQTFAEMKAPSGEWKSTIGLALIFASLSVWVYMAMKLFVRSQPHLLFSDRTYGQIVYESIGNIVVNKMSDFINPEKNAISGQFFGVNFLDRTIDSEGEVLEDKTRLPPPVLSDLYSPLPETFSEERQKAQLKRMIDLEVNPVEGLSSQWDYEKGEWKK